MLSQPRVSICSAKALPILLSAQLITGELWKARSSWILRILFIQVGPTCGLTALSILLGGKPTAAQLLEDAIAQEFTINGELFSAQYLFELTRKHLPGPGSCQLHQGHLSCKKVKELLKAGGCLLVPYPFSKVIHQLKFKPSLSSGFPHIKPRLRLTVTVERLTARCYQPVL